MSTPRLTIALPSWVDICIGEFPGPLADHDSRMALVLELARENVAFGGGPFAAAVFESRSGLLLAPGINQVLAGGSSILHAEVVALMLAQNQAGHFDLGAAGMSDYELVTSTEPCAMCLGAIPWSGVRRLVCGARDADAREVGFDEGDKPPAWEGGLAARGIEVVRDVRRDEAARILRRYRDAGGPIYNGRGG